jgi:peptidyl-prolyl cis-trans isomerase B (cyclophilin B)
MSQLPKGRVWGAFALAAILAAIASGCGGGSSDSTGASTAASGCKEVEAPEPKEVSLPVPKQTVKAGEKLTAVVRTSCGAFEIALDTQKAPQTVNSFAYLAREGFYDGLDFYKTISGFAIYGGDPALDGSGGPGYSVVEPPPASARYGRGVVAMAREPGQPSGYSGSAFFVVTSVETGFPPEYAPLGEVSEGYGTVARIDGLATPKEVPRQAVLIEKVTIEKG